MVISPVSLYIGLKGYFQFHSPFDGAYHLEDEYLTIEHVSAINDLVYDHVDIYNQYFAYYKLTKAQYTAFLNDNGVIVTFKAHSGDRYSVPNTFIKALPNPSDIPYRQLGLNVVIGPLPVGYNVDALRDQISQAVLITFGVKAVITFLPMSPVMLLEQTTPPSPQSYYDPLKTQLSNISLATQAIQSMTKAVLNPVILPTQSVLSEAVFGGGGTNSSPMPLSTTSIYTYATNVATTGTNLAYDVMFMAAAGNSTVGVFGGGFGPNVQLNTVPEIITSSVTSIYTYASNVCSSGTNLSGLVIELAAAGNSTVGVFGGGLYATAVSSAVSDISSVTNIYTYVNNILTAGTNLTHAAVGLVAVGNSTLGVFGTGMTLYNTDGSASPRVSSTCLYTYASNTAVAGANLTYKSTVGATIGNSTIGLFGGGVPSGNEIETSTTSIYTYASNTTATGANLAMPMEAMGGASDSTTGVFGGGANSTTIISNVSIYKYSSGIFSAGNNLTYEALSLAATSSYNLGVNT